ncbi:uncharacterized protein LOC8060212 [Sorghum bicolor]|uniref:GPI-anchored protein LLG1-like domain-containing protein n=1 Tax=Sorghum bicolor TaxID=4558 RepID=C5YBI9_SORBI|nr:uncharacterized protein LOC8060212 [Sorghum bicolor]EES11072.1 hypothetical protein SORBI_3006G136700 [Sorghum bicolor]|eukprot:XP_002446744.1 uncharacterized protein LOC8060212 [Sorghum bicolor]
MGPTGTSSAAILFCCICVVVSLSSSMVVVRSAVPEETPKFNVVSEENPKAIAAAKEIPKSTVVPEETPKSTTTLEENPKSTAIPEETPNSTDAPKETPKFISMGALECSANITMTKPARKLGAVVEGVCPVRFDHTRGISAVAGSCRDRPRPSPERCCGALKTFACPYSDLINDNDHNGCASDMFYQIIVRGRLRPGLFSQMCVEGPLGLSC